MRRHILQTECGKPRLKLRKPIAIELIAALNECVIGNGCDRRCLSHGVGVERLADPIHQIGEFGLRETKTHPQPRQPVHLGQSSGQHEIGIFAHPPGGIETQCRIEVLVVGLIEHHHHLLRHLLQEPLDARGREKSAGGIVGVGDEQHPGVGRDGCEHRVEVVAVVARGHHNGAGTDRMRGKRVDGEGILRIHGRGARLQDRMGGNLEYVVRTIAERDPVGRYRIARSDRRLQFEPVGIRIAAQFAHRGHHRLARRFRHTQRIFVGREFHDLSLVQTVFASQFGDGLASLIRRHAADIVGGLELHRNHSPETGRVRGGTWAD